MNMINILIQCSVLFIRGEWWVKYLNLCQISTLKKRHLGIFVFKDSKMGISGCMLHACTWDVKGATTPQLPKLSGNHRTSKYMISDAAQFWMCQS